MKNIYKALKQYRGIISIAYKNYTVYIHDLVGINIIYILRLSIIIFMYKAIFAMAWTNMISGYTIQELVRALIFVQTVVISKARITDEIDQDIKTGKIWVYLLNPVHYIRLKFLEFFPKFLYNLCITWIVGLILGWCFLGSISTSLGWILWGIVLVFGGMLVCFFWYMMVGLLWFYTEDNNAFRLIYSKIDLFFGGNILPLAFMPALLQTIAFASPFAQSGYSAGLLFSNFSMPTFLHYLGIQIVWITILIWTCFLIFNHAKKRLVINGW